MRFQNLYLWLVFLASLDIILTRFILFFSGVELNPIAIWVMEKGGIVGLSIFKFSAVVFVILVCEFIARVRPRTARRLAIICVVISMVPVVWSSILMVSMLMADELPPIESVEEASVCMPLQVEQI